MSRLGGPRHKGGDTVTGLSSGTHIYSEVAPFLYLAINSVFPLILVPSFPRFAACRCAFPASSATSSVTATYKEMNDSYQSFREIKDINFRILSFRDSSPLIATI